MDATNTSAPLSQPQTASDQHQPDQGMPSSLSQDQTRQAWQALGLWGVFFVSLVLINGTIPFLLGADMRGWTFSSAKGFLINLILYGGLCLVGPLLLSKGWKTLRQPGFWGPLAVAMLALLLRGFWPYLAGVIVLVLAYLHWRYNLSDLGVRSRGWQGDVVAIVLLGLLSLAAPLFSSGPHTIVPGAALSAGLTRLFANPASTTENLFYFGFLTARLAPKTGRWFTPLLIGAMYTTHEMSNPEYWYGGTPFVFIFVAVTVMAALYVWRRSLMVTWLGDGLSRFASRLIA